MKRLITVFCSLVLIIIVCSSCSCKKNNEKASLQVGDMNATTYEEVTMNMVNDKIEDKDSFILFVYKVDCYGCKLFKPILENAIKERNLIVYALQAKNIESGHELNDLRYTPSIVIYKEGKVLLMTDPVKNEEYFSDNKGFLSLLDKYTYMPTLYYINKAQLDEKINNNESFIIYYSRSSCSDCSYLNRKYLKEYLNNNVETKYFYIIETDVEGIRYTNNEYDSMLWQDFKDDYGLSNANNALGHGVGYVPTMQYYENGEIKEMMVYFNDVNDEGYIQNNDGSYSVVINNSYYDDNPYIGQTIAYLEYKDKLSSFYNNKLKSFLDTNLEKVD